MNGSYWRMGGTSSNLQDKPEIGNLELAAKDFTNIGPGSCTYGAPGGPYLATWFQGAG
jgi:hypothetical protein